MIAAIAETNRVPFDLPEAETELVAGFHTEYSSIKFSAVLQRRIHQHDHRVDAGDDAVSRRLERSVRCSSFRGSALFYFFAKILFFLFLYIWLRGTLPRFRFDQLMDFGWKFLVPAAILNIVVTATVQCFGVFDYVAVSEAEWLVR